MVDKKKAVGYIRVSTKQQGGDDKYGIDAQKSAILKYADDNGFWILDWFIDEVSGTSMNRPALDTILFGQISNPPIEAVIVYKNDRIARDTKLYFYYLFVLERKGIKLFATQEEFDEGGEFADIYRALLQFVAMQERRNIVLRTSHGRFIKAEQGGYSGGRAPYGYKVVDKQLIIEPKEREIVKLVFDLRDQGKKLPQIAEELEKRGMKTRGGGKFQNSTLKSILDKRPFYEGYYKYGKEMEYVEGIHEAILPRSGPDSPTIEALEREAKRAEAERKKAAKELIRRAKQEERNRLAAEKEAEDDPFLMEYQKEENARTVADMWSKFGFNVEK